MTVRPALLPPMAVFAAATLVPVGLLAMGVHGGLWAGAAVIYMMVFSAVMDRFVPWVMPDAPEGAEFPAAEPLLVMLGLLHFAVMAGAVWAAAGDSGLSVAARAAVAFGAGLWVGQVAVPAAHELIHRPDRGRFWLGAMVYASILFGHHASAHRLVHHRHVATRDDPNTARAGEGFWRFLPRAWAGSYRAGLAAERARRGPGRVTPYAGYLAGSLVALAAGFAVAGWLGAVVWAAIGVHAATQLLMSDYVQHYGLVRRVRPDGRPEPVGARHSWNAPHWFTAGLTLNAPRHSDHHAHPARPYPSLRLPGPEEAPYLPWSLPVSCAVALVPPLWRRKIAPHLARWRG